MYSALPLHIPAFLLLPPPPFSIPSPAVACSDKCQQKVVATTCAGGPFAPLTSEAAERTARVPVSGSSLLAVPGGSIHGTSFPILIENLVLKLI